MLFFYNCVIGLDINFPQYSACEAGRLIDYSMSGSCTYPLFCISAAKYVVLFPGAAQASITLDSGCTLLRYTGIQLAYEKILFY